VKAICRFCKSSFDLNSDSVQARNDGTDPLRQMQRHIGQCGHAMIAGFNSAVLINSLCFTSPDEPEKLRNVQRQLFDWLQAGGIEDQNFVLNPANARPNEATPHAGGKE
jgi:hypothetical protein